ncbi:MAG: hypothetical protein ACJATF_002392 [Flavobacteriales bacterium]|jgi:hypothetical protein
MKKTFTILLLLILITATTGFSQNLLRILTTNWGDVEGAPGSITEATFTVQPQGAYMDIGMYLTMTDEVTGFPESEWLEAVLDFNLPEGSIVYDSWLWMMDDTTIVKADVLDIWSATQDYDAIVDRQSDPSILYRKANGSHQIRVYPVPGGGSRKVKISYLVPAIWSADDVSTWLPLDILTASYNPLEEFRILTFPNSTWANPRLAGLSGVTFENAQDATFGDILLADLPMSSIEKPFRFEVDAPLNNDGVFAQKLEDGMDQFYQLVYIPPTVLQTTESKKLIFLFDHEEGRTQVNRTELLKNFKKNCLANLDEEDQFSLAFSTADGSIFFSDTFLNADTTAITSAYEEINSFITSYSDVLQIMEDGVSFILENGGEGELVLFASSNDVNWWDAENRERRDTLYQRILDNDIKVHIVNYQDSGFYYEWVWQGPDFWTYRNQEFYQDLTISSSGNMYGSLEGSSIVWESIASLFNTLKSNGHDFDLHTSLNNGFTFDRFEQKYLGQSENTNQPMLQIGKYVGDFPLELEYSSFTDSTFVFENITVEPSDVYEADSLTREIWFGHHLREMEGLAVASNSIQEVIDLSIEERVLTKFTAFLALDLEQGAEACLGCWEFDETLLIATGNLNEEAEIQMTAFPNPFKDVCTIDLKIKEGSKIKEATLRIVDAFGKNILTKDLSELVAAKQTQWQWNGQDASGQRIAPGVYFVILQTDKGVGTVKLTLMK